MTPDTAALRAHALAYIRGERLDPVSAYDVDALCDAADEVERLRGGALGTTLGSLAAERDAASTALAALVADLRALHFRTNGYSNGAEFDCCVTCFDGDEQPEPWPCPTAAAIDRHAPEVGS